MAAFVLITRRRFAHKKSGYKNIRSARFLRQAFCSYCNEETYLTDQKK